jgi:hypothetical protein
VSDLPVKRPAQVLALRNPKVIQPAKIVQISWKLKRFLHDRDVQYDAVIDEMMH